MLWLANTASRSKAVLSSGFLPRVKAQMRVILLAESALFDSIRTVLCHGRAYMLCQLTHGFTTLLFRCRDLYNFRDNYTCFQPPAISQQSQAPSLLVIPAIKVLWGTAAAMQKLHGAEMSGRAVSPGIYLKVAETRRHSQTTECSYFYTYFSNLSLVIT